jgi:hypothetical protein
MELINGILGGTPHWVWFLLAYLVFIGIKARGPGEVSLVKLATVPVVLTAWSLHELTRLFDPTPGAVGLWLVGVAAGLSLGVALVRRLALTVDRARGVIRHPGDKTLLPLVLATFLVKYGFGVMQAMSPGALRTGWAGTADLVLSGFFVGIFLGKFATYALRYRRAGEAVAAG